jgi:peptide deformylase
MAILRVTKYGEDILRQKLKPVDYKKLAPKLPKLLKDMEETCLAVRGVGLAANQIGLDYRMAIILIPQSEEENAPLERYVLINPKI